MQKWRYTMAESKVVHKKIKNTGIIFELLTRQLTTDIMTGKNNSIAERLIEMYFKSNSVLGKEYLLYQALMKYKYEDASRAEDYLNEVIKSHGQLNKSDLKKSKYNLIKEIRDNYDADSFFSPKIDDYKVLASIYKLFKSKSEPDSVMPHDVIDSKYSIIEHISKKKFDVQDPVESDAVTEYKKQTKDLRMLTYKMMVDKFNDKYKNLNSDQKNLIKEYINNISSEDSLHVYINSQLPKINNKLKYLSEKITNKPVTIKINEVLKQVNLLSESENLDDCHVVALLNVYELIKELNITIQNWEK